MSTKSFSTLDTSCLKSLVRLALLFAAFLSKNNICNRKMEWLGYLLFFVVFLTVLNYLTLRCPWKADKSLPNKVKFLELISLLSTLSWNCFLKLGCLPNEIFLYWDNVPQQIFWSLQRLLLDQDCRLCWVNQQRVFLWTGPNKAEKSQVWPGSCGDALTQNVNPGWQIILRRRVCSQWLPMSSNMGRIIPSSSGLGWKRT